MSSAAAPTPLPAWLHTPSGLLRARALNLPFDGQAGTANAITDVPGVEVGYVTVIEGHGPLRMGHGPVRSGVTAILPLGRAGVGRACAAGIHALNGNGEMTGQAWIEESGGFNMPVLISNTHAIGACHRGSIDWVLKHHPELAQQWLLPVVAETWDGYLNDINGAHITPEMAVAAIEAARPGPIDEGSVGGGTGMNCYGFKGGSGTASREVSYGPARYTVGVFLQSNFGARHELVVAGRPLGRQLLEDNPMGEYLAGRAAGAGSCIAVVATDAPLLPQQCKALARRVSLGLARTGTTGSHFSGDIFIAFSTANAGALDSHFPLGTPDANSYKQLRFIPWGRMDDLFNAAVQATEEAVLNSLVANAEMVGRDGHRSPALPHAALRATLGHAAS